jgi:hypothetical protein
MPRVQCALGQPLTKRFEKAFLAAVWALACLFWGCQAKPEAPSAEIAFVARKELPIRSELAPRSKTVSTLALGTPVEIVGRKRRSVRIRTVEGITGWTHESELISTETRGSLGRVRKLAADQPSQGGMRAFDTLNVHLEPYRESPTIYQLAQNEEVELLRQTRVDRPDGVTESWSLVRLISGDAGWALGSRLYPAIPIEVAQYAEGRRITAYFALGELVDQPSGESRTTWLWTQTSKGLDDRDFDRFRVFRWSKAREAYQTIKLERGVKGRLPILVTPTDDPSGEGWSFAVQVEIDGRWVERTYRLQGQRVISVGEAPAAAPIDLLRPLQTSPSSDSKPPDLRNRLI